MKKENKYPFCLNSRRWLIFEHPRFCPKGCWTYCNEGCGYYEERLPTPYLKRLLKIFEWMKKEEK